jgi:hypothetical protein
MNQNKEREKIEAKAADITKRMWELAKKAKEDPNFALPIENIQKISQLNTELNGVLHQLTKLSITSQQ